MNFFKVIINRMNNSIKQLVERKYELEATLTETQDRIQEKKEELINLTNEQTIDINEHTDNLYKVTNTEKTQLESDIKTAETTRKTKIGEIDADEKKELSKWILYKSDIKRKLITEESQKKRIDAINEEKSEIDKAKSTYDNTVKGRVAQARVVVAQGAQVAQGAYDEAKELVDAYDAYYTSTTNFNINKKKLDREIRNLEAQIPSIFRKIKQIEDKLPVNMPQKVNITAELEKKIQNTEIKLRDAEENLKKVQLPVQPAQLPVQPTQTTEPIKQQSIQSIQSTQSTQSIQPTNKTSYTCEYVKPPADADELLYDGKMFYIQDLNGNYYQNPDAKVLTKTLEKCIKRRLVNTTMATRRQEQEKRRAMSIGMNTGISARRMNKPRMSTVRNTGRMNIERNNFSNEYNGYNLNNGSPSGRPPSRRPPSRRPPSGRPVTRRRVSYNNRMYNPTVRNNTGAKPYNRNRQIINGKHVQLKKKIVPQARMNLHNRTMMNYEEEAARLARLKTDKYRKKAETSSYWNKWRIGRNSRKNEKAIKNRMSDITKSAKNTRKASNRNSKSITKEHKRLCGFKSHILGGPTVNREHPPSMPNVNCTKFVKVR